MLDEIERLRQQTIELEAKLSCKEDQFRIFLKGLNFGYWEWDSIKNCFISYSNEIAVIFGLSHQEFGDRFHRLTDFYDIIHPQDLQHFKKHAAKDLKYSHPPDEPHIFDYRIIRPDNEIRHIRQLDFRVIDDQGVVAQTFGLMQDITEQQETVSNLQKSDERYSALFHQLPIGVQEEDYRSIKKVVDKLRYKGVEDLKEYFLSHSKILFEMVSSTRITNVNERLLEIYQADSLRDYLYWEEKIESWWDAEWVEYFAAEISALAGPNKIYDTERIDTRADGSYFETRSISSIVKGFEDSWERVITIYEDITERKKYEAAIIDANVMAETANRDKSEFISRLSHELRTPLNAILGYVHLFADDKTLGEKQQSNARKINSVGQQLRHLIDEVLDLAHIESDKLELKAESVSIEEVLANSVAWIATMAQSRGVKIKFDQTDFRDLQIEADPVRLKQVFTNLLTNAVKFSDENGLVTVICSVDKNQLVHIGIRDTGPGIPENKISDLYRPFNRLGKENSGAEATGIGLAITKKLISKMQGHLRVQSKLGKGSTFWVEFKLLESTKEEHAIASPADSRPESETILNISSVNSKILVAEDNKINREVMAAQLEVLGLEADYADNGGEALKLWKTGKYHLLLTDVRMPVMDGHELVRRIRLLELESNQAAPIIAITASAMESDVRDCLEAGVNEVIAKPVQLDELQRALEKYLEIRNLAEREPDKKVSSEEDSTTVIDLSVLQKSIGDKLDLQRQLMSSYADDLPNTLEKIRSAFAWHNNAQLAEIAHKLKSSTRSLGALEMADACQALELASKKNSWPDIHSSLPVVMLHASQVLSFIERFCEQPSVQKTDQKPIDIDDDFTEFSINVLIVDDDYIMHRMTTLMLNDLGIKNVFSALSGSIALDIIDEQANEIDLVICDLNMPEMDGVELVRHLAERQFEGAMIFASGEDIRIMRTVEKLAAEHDLHVLGSLEKPVTLAKLGKLLESFDQIQSDGTVLQVMQCNLDELREAIANEDIGVYFQPKVDLITRAVVGVEALARWHHPDKGMIGPNAFIPMAEENNLIVDLTRVVSIAAIRHAAWLQQQGYNINVAINISVDSLSSLDWPDEMVKYVEASGLSPSNITLEITESRLIEHLSVALDILSRLSLKRFNLSIDDFGTGYSSMEQLQLIPFSELKIDRAFVTGAGQDSSARAILESSILLAKKLDITVVAEGVETQQDWELMLELGCDQVQGYYMARPMPINELVNWLDRWKAAKH
ncbi:MAG: EAL domain-containing protein [Proteobacteria bacterium]|nr:EAL domain-containing protein [Pseudomonadota bacterium]